MHYSQREKYEIIQLVEQSDLGVNRTLRELKVNKTTFYNWYNAYVEMGFDGLARKASKRTGSWNKINMADRDKVVEIALEKPELSSREVAWYITDNYKYYISTEDQTQIPHPLCFVSSVKACTRIRRMGTRRRSPNNKCIEIPRSTGVV